MRVNLVEDLSELTTIQLASLNRLVKQSMWIICDAVEAAVHNKDDSLDIDIGLGTLKINFDNEEVKYKFIPKPTLENGISRAIVEEQNPLQLALEKSLADKITNVYKEFF